ncbi:S41 family peptidase [Peijinzhouia sedimentorum]
MNKMNLVMIFERLTRKLILTIFCFYILCFSACEMVLFDETVPNDPVSNFEILWNTMNDRYALFEVKNIDWDSVYQIYRPLVNSSMSNNELFDVCFEMLSTLEDGHIYLRGDSDRREYVFLPNVDQTVFNKSALFAYYLSNKSETVDGMIYRDFEDIGYIFYESFTSNLTDKGLDEVFEKFKDKKGLIIDLRNNSGGNPDNAFKLAERLVTERREVIHSKVKIGSGRSDFSATEIFNVAPKPIGFDGPVIILTSGITFSAANLFVAIMHNYDHVDLIGRTSGGGGGIPAVYELPNGWTFSYSASLITMPDGYVIENGFNPDIFVQISSGFILIGRDTILEYSINNLRNRSN